MNSDLSKCLGTSAWERCCSLVVLGLLGLSAVVPAPAQIVDVTLSLDTNTVAVGESTTLRVFAQVIPSERTNVNRILTWYVDVLNHGATNVTADYDNMVQPGSEPGFSSSGTTSGDHRIGIYGAFLSSPEIVPGPGVNEPVELMAIPLNAIAPGTAQFTVRAGTGVEGLSADFRVVTTDLGELTGGNYGAAMIELTNTGVMECDVTLNIARTGSGGPGEELTLTFVPCPGFNHTVESSPGLEPGMIWTPLPGAPHNSGTVTVTNSVTREFFRVSTTP